MVIGAWELLGRQVNPLAEDMVRINREARERYMRFAMSDQAPWPGNFRELEQCVRNLVLRGEYRPAGPLARGGAEDWNALIESGALTAEELLRRHLQDKGDWPKGLILDLWGSATMRTAGEEVAMALHLAGLAPRCPARSDRCRWGGSSAVTAG